MLWRLSLFPVSNLISAGVVVTRKINVHQLFQVYSLLIFPTAYINIDKTIEIATTQSYPEV